jgi:small subunit ribosomal protein S16
MVVIRLRRAGSKKRPFFRVVVTDSRAARDSSFVEVLGHYNPRTKPEVLTLKRDRVEHWLKLGAQASDTVRTLIDRNPAPPADATASSGNAPVTAEATAPLDGARGVASESRATS